MFVPTSYRLFFSEELKISESFPSCPPLRFSLLLFLSQPWIFLSRHLVKRFFSFGFSVVLSGPREGNQQKMFDLLDAVPSNAPSILGFSFRTPDLSFDYLLLARISILPVFPTLLHFATCLCAIVNANGSDPFCRNHRIVREIKFYLIKENF